MSGINEEAKHSEKGLLTPDNCVVTLIDRQPQQILFGVTHFVRQSIIDNNVALAKTTKIIGAPVALSMFETKRFSCNLWP
ncbi:MAG: hypothetical protein ACXV7J_15175 [Methylomonas sp.]